jgi:hypothetical protein
LLYFNPPDSCKETYFRGQPDCANHEGLWGAVKFLWQYDTQNVLKPSLFKTCKKIWKNIKCFLSVWLKERFRSQKKKKTKQEHKSS